MATFQRPGVYVQETLTPLSLTASTPGQSSAAFVGIHGQGPLVPTQITSWSQFIQLYGGFELATDYLPYAVYQYFNNGGRSAWVVRAVAADAATASVTLQDTAGTPDNIITLTASSPGAWGNNLSVQVVPGGSGIDHFSLLVLNSGTVVERFVDISPNPQDSRNALAVINSQYAGSKFVIATFVFGGTYSTSVNALAAVSSAKSLASGSDGSATPNLVTATQQLDMVTGPLDVNLPGVTNTSTLNSVITYTSGSGRMFLVIDVASQGVGAASSTATTAYTAYEASLTPTSYAAVYGPWLQVSDPASLAVGATRLLPAGGAVLGLYSATDVQRGTQKPAAGIGAKLSGVINTEVSFVSGDLDTLNTSGVNIIRAIPGNGFCIFGARTLAPGLPSQYISVRRTLISIEETLKAITRFAIFEPNSSPLWSQISSVCSQYLLGLMQAGTIAGTTPAQSFFIECDSTNNTPSTVASGYVYIDIGVALLSPAEFIVIRIGQYEGGSSSSSTTS
jgi:phage tail sheath protein FI